MHCRIFDRHFNVFFAEIQLKKENLERVFSAPEFGRPNRYAGLPNGLNTSLPKLIKFSNLDKKRNKLSYKSYKKVNVSFYLWANVLKHRYIKCSEGIF